MRTRSASLTLAALALTTACSGSSKPQVLPSLTRPPTPTVTPVAVPSEARVHNAFGAAAFVRFYFSTLDSAYQAGVAFPRDLSTADCNSCANFARVASELTRQRHHFVGPSFTGLDAEASPVAQGQTFVTVSCELPSRREVDASGRLVKTYPAEGHLVLTVLVKITRQGWAVRAMRTER